MKINPKVTLCIIIVGIVILLGCIKLFPKISEGVKQTEASNNNTFSVYEIY